MALSRSMLKGMGLTDEQISAIIDAHSETVEALKKERDQNKEAAEKYADTKRELDEIKSNTDSWKEKYESEHTEFNKYKKDIADKERSENIKAAYRKLLVDQKVGEKHIDLIMRATDFKDFNLGEDGKLADEQKIIESIKNEWSDFIGTVSTKGMNVDNPPINGTNRLTKEDIYKKDEHGRYIMSTSERQKALMENFNQ